ALLGGATAILLAVCAAATAVQVHCWHDTLSLWEHAISVNSEDPGMVRQLFAYYQKFEGDRHEHWRTPAFQERDPRYAAAQNRLGSIPWKQGDRAEALRWFRQAPEVDPQLVPAHASLAMILEQRGELEAAAGHYDTLIRLQPDQAEHRRNYARVLEQVGRREA